MGVGRCGRRGCGCEGQALALRAPRRFFSVPCEGQALALRLRRRAAQATVVRGPVPRNHSLILAILFILAILLQTECMRGTGPRATGTEAFFSVPCEGQALALRAPRRFFSVPCEGQALALRLRRRAAQATVVRGPVPRNHSLILAILQILAILLQNIF